MKFQVNNLYGSFHHEKFVSLSTFGRFSSARSEAATFPPEKFHSNQPRGRIT